MPNYEESTHNGQVIREALSLHPEGLTKEDLLSLIQDDLQGIKGKPIVSINTTLQRAKDIVKATVDGEERYFLAKFVPMDSEVANDAKEPDIVTTEESEPENPIVQTASLSGRRTKGSFVPRTEESRGRTGIDVTIITSPLEYSNVTEIRLEYENGKIGNEVPPWTDLRICIGPNAPVGWTKMQIFTGVKQFTIYEGTAQRGDAIQPIGNTIYVAPK